MRQGTASMFWKKPRLTTNPGAVSRDLLGKLELSPPAVLDERRRMRLAFASTAALALGVFLLLGALGCMAATVVGDAF